MKNNPLPRLDSSLETREKLLPFCRLKFGEIWTDPVKGHRVGCLDTSNPEHLFDLMSSDKAILAIHDPPYNVAALQIRSTEDYITGAKSGYQVLMMCWMSTHLFMFG